MGTGDLAAADPLPRILRRLGSHPAVVDAAGSSGRVGARNEAPYPRLVLTHTGGADRGLRWLLAPEIQVEAFDDLDGATGREGLRRLLYVALGVLVELVDEPVPAGEPVITAVESVRGGGWVPVATGQGRYVAVVRVFTHPPASGP